MFPTTRRAVAIALATSLGFWAHTASAEDLSATISCLRGNVPAYDYAELGQKLRESLFDRKGGVSLVSSYGGLKLRVTDPNGQSVCQETANNSTSCTFKIEIASVDEFTITVDNAEVGQDNGYKICAF